MLEKCVAPAVDACFLSVCALQMVLRRNAHVTQESGKVEFGAPCLLPGADCDREACDALSMRILPKSKAG